ncbi:MAG: acyltransferase [Eubacteriales bacterium]|nr:acyltransferase [Eubacteriales bacterium]MDD3881242.1 acyltransferase [Eubacteriales bacterium]MDD4512160.1 acyltransferase [Eubacteriales bacterium]
MTQRKRENWIDNIKVISCVLVAAGHLFMGLTDAGIVSASNAFLGWFHTAIYTFHVQLFFLCSGYLYQKYAKADSLTSWGMNVRKKAIALGIPYFAFSVLTWLMKKAAAGAVNTQAGGFIDSIFVHPMDSMWFIYVLFFMFLITPTFRSRKALYIALAVSAALYFTDLFVFQSSVVLIYKLMQFEIWFILGMLLASFDLKAAVKEKRTGILSAIFGGLFIAGTILYANGSSFKGFSLLLGLLASASLMLLFLRLDRRGKSIRAFAFISGYTMPIYVMHTIFAAAIRTLLTKIGIMNPAVHIILGLVFSFGGPILAAYIMSKVKWLDFFLYPLKYIKLKSAK